MKNSQYRIEYYPDLIFCFSPIELDFEELPQAANNSNNTAKWFQEHQDINAGKILDGLLSLKTEFPDDSSNGSNPGSSSSMDKPPDMASLDHTTANLLQMSVPDPSTTFLGKIMGVDQ